LRAVDDAGIGEAAYSNIVAILTDSSTTILPESTTQFLPVSATPTVGVVTAASKPRGTDKIIVAAGVAGSFLFLVLVVIVLFFVRKRIRNKQREQSVKEFQSWHERHAECSSSPTSALLQLDTFKRKREIQPEEISYVVLLKDWDISPSHLKLLDKKLGAGQFGMVKEGLYTSSENSIPEVVAVKMLKGI
ncbi:receptor-type tyrosine- phosphatase delta-like, partial [Paramuricea clavata]